MPGLVSVNVGSPTLLPGSHEPTGIVKVPRSGPVLVDALGLVGDAVLDRKHHGGPDQAIYVYLADDYRWWEAELGEALAPGTFGENLTIAGVAGDQLAIGDRFAFGEVAIEITYHRTPCNTLARRMGSPGWVKRFAKALRPGGYARVLVPGTVEAGSEAVYTPFTGTRVTVAELMSFDGARNLPHELMRRVLATPVREKTRLAYQARLAEEDATT
ncbi:MAG TPA: MOSC domain-containing protein [Devosiaceae bacterium]|jgi:MOSC domain-containing protein YiiM|nr:MOSC domain-containing protein [Devosiaceae bacterium]